MKVFGLVYDFDLNNKVIALKNYRNLTYYFLSTSHMKKFKKYIYKGNVVSFECSYINYKISKKYKSYNIDYFYEISVPNRYGKEILYSKYENSKGVRKVLNNLENKLFLDIEMSMPEYGEKVFTPEMIQVGYLLVDKFDHIIKEESYYIKLSKYKTLSRRTEDFLNINLKTLETKGIKYTDFYKIYKELILKYNPTVIIFGKNDKKFLESSFALNKLESLNSITRFINISQLIKTFYELPNDPGLFRIYESYYDKEHHIQRHDALEDAFYTYYVFKAFKKCVNEIK